MGRIQIKSADEIKKQLEACSVTVQILDAVADVVRPGISTEDINTFVHDMTLKLGAKPSTLNYKGYPKSVCTSINDVICHGIPDPYVILRAGDIINVDVTSYKSGFHGDSSRMYFVGGRGACSKESQELVDCTFRAMLAGIATIRPGARTGDIGAAIQDYVKSLGKNYGIVRDYTGHGVGREFHEAPQIVHIGRRGVGDVLKAGMVFTVEPMINAGDFRTTLSKIDGWTVRTVDGSLSAQWEHTVLVTDSGYRIMTESKLAVP